MLQSILRSNTNVTLSQLQPINFYNLKNWMKNLKEM